jgi:hypothetical protein
MSVTPRLDLFLRPEEKHVASREDNIVPPFRGWYQTMEEPL